MCSVPDTHVASKVSGAQIKGVSEPRSKKDTPHYNISMSEEQENNVRSEVRGQSRVRGWGFSNITGEGFIYDSLNLLSYILGFS